MLEPSHKLRAEGDDQSFFRLGKPFFPSTEWEQFVALQNWGLQPHLQFVWGFAELDGWDKNSCQLGQKTMEIFHGEGEHAMSNMMGVGWRFAGDQGAIETIEIVDVGDHAPGNSPVRLADQWW